MQDRRRFLQHAAALGAGGLSLRGQTQARRAMPADQPAPTAPPATTTGPGVQTPDLKKLPWTDDGGVKVFQLVAEPVRQELIPGKTLDLWGFNGSAPGPLIEANQGDRLRIVFDNHLPEPIAIHWHGLEVPNAMDGVMSLTQPPVLPGGRFVYEFTLRQEGTYFYHSHMAMQEMMGLIGPLILHPSRPYSTAVDQDYVIVLQEYAARPNNPVPDSMAMEFNWLTMNGKSGPATTPLIIRHNQRVKIRLINLGMDAHPIHLHGFQFWITGTEGGRQPESNWIRRNTVLVGVAQAFDLEFHATHLGEWMLHCHLPHHMMNHMVSPVGPLTRGTMTGAGRGAGKMAGMPGMAGAAMHGMALPPGWIAPNANRVPGFPQDAYMEGPMAAMDAAVAKPETYGLPPGWSGAVQGMMTLVRVLEPAMFDHIERLRAAAGGQS